MTHPSEPRPHVVHQAHAAAEQRAARTFLLGTGTTTPEHICGNCRTPTGRSALPCKNDPKRSDR